MNRRELLQYFSALIATPYLPNVEGVVKEPDRRSSASPQSSICCSSCCSSVSSMPSSSSNSGDYT